MSTTKHTFDRKDFDARRAAKSAAKTEVAELRDRLAVVTADVDKLKKGGKA